MKRLLWIIAFAVLGLLPVLVVTAVAVISYKAPVDRHYRPSLAGQSASVHESGAYPANRGQGLAGGPNAGVTYEFTLGFVEFNDDGYLVDPDQESAVLREIQQLAGDRDAVILLFIHGWNHNAAADDENVACFQEFLRAVSVMQARNARAGKHPQAPVYGVYAGWPGLVYDRDSKEELATFWGRESAVDRLAERGDLLALISRINAIKHRSGTGRSKFIVVGHSLGGRALYKTLRPFMQDAAAADDERLPPLADMAVMVNPALSADEHRSLKGLIQSKGGASLPQYIIATSETDSVLGKVFPLSLKLGSFVRGDYGLNATERMTALGQYPPNITHTLRLEDIKGKYAVPKGGQACPTFNFTDLDIVNGVSRVERKDDLYKYDVIEHHDDQGALLYKTVLSPVVGNSGPIMVVSVSGQIIPDHNTIFTAPFVDFVARAVNSELRRAAEQGEDGPSARDHRAGE